MSNLMTNNGNNTKAGKFLCIGPGGRDCPCCFPAPGSTWRKKEMKSAKKRSNREWKRERDYE